MARARSTSSLHKPDLIGIAAFEMLVGREPDGTIALLYPAFDVAVLLGLGWIAWRLIRLVRRFRLGADVTPRPLGSRWLGVVAAIWLNAIVPVELLVAGPGLLGAPWSTLVRIDLGLVLFAFAILRLATGLVLVTALVRAARSRRRAPGDRAAVVAG